MTDKAPKENSTNCFHLNGFGDQSYKGKIERKNQERISRQSMCSDLVPYTSDIETTKAFLFETIDVIVRYITEINDHQSPVGRCAINNFVCRFRCVGD